jgi:4-hydroxy-tetrahydrodipicolinate reductase
MAQWAAEHLTGFDPEIFEVHHRYKRDAPSGTAYALGEAVQAGRPGLSEVPARAGEQPRGENELGYATLRGGDVPGEHTVFFFGEGERVELTHRSSTSNIFASGALRAALWLAEQAPGRYTMRHVIT